MEKEIAYSVVIPFYNEKESAPELLKAVSDVMGGLEGAYEIIAVDDGSTDGTYEKLEKARSTDPSVVPVRFSGNRGQTACLAEGFRKAKGRIMISMDGDLQDDPREIPGMLEQMKRSGADAVCGWRKDRKDKARTMSLSRMGNFFQKIFFNVPVHDISCTLRVYSAEAAKSIDFKAKGLHRFIPFLLKRAGFALSEKEVHHSRRKYGQSKYSLRKAPQTVKLFFGLLLGRY